MAKTETTVSNLKINTGTYANIQANLSSIGEDELIITDDKNIPIPSSADNGKVISIDSNGEFNLISATLTGNSAPTTSTAANFVGHFYLDTTTSKLYQCTAVTEDTSTTPSTFSYTWNEIGGGTTTTYETYTISNWTALSSSSPYTYQATVTATATIGNDTEVELINDQSVLFATYGFAIGSISGQNVTIYSIGEPSSSVTLKIGYGG
jgi:hypothetical protein